MYIHIYTYVYREIFMLIYLYILMQELYTLHGLRLAYARYMSLSFMNIHIYIYIYVCVYMYESHSFLYYCIYYPRLSYTVQYYSILYYVSYWHTVAAFPVRHLLQHCALLPAAGNGGPHLVNNFHREIFSDCVHVRLCSLLMGRRI